MPLRAILGQFTFNLLAPVVMFPFKCQHHQPLEVEVCHLKVEAIWSSWESSKQVESSFGSTTLVSDLKLTAVVTICTKRDLIWRLPSWPWNDETIHCQNIFSIWATFRLMGANQSDWLMSWFQIQYRFLRARLQKCSEHYRILRNITFWASWKIIDTGLSTLTVSLIAPWWLKGFDVMNDDNITSYSTS